MGLFLAFLQFSFHGDGDWKVQNIKTHPIKILTLTPVTDTSGSCCLSVPCAAHLPFFCEISFICPAGVHYVIERCICFLFPGKIEFEVCCGIEDLRPGYLICQEEPKWQLKIGMDSTPTVSEKCDHKLPIWFRLYISNIMHVVGIRHLRKMYVVYNGLLSWLCHKHMLTVQCDLTGWRMNSKPPSRSFCVSYFKPFMCHSMPSTFHKF